MNRKVKIHAKIAFNGSSYAVHAIANGRNIDLCARTFDLAKQELISTLKMLRAFGSIIVINTNIMEQI